MSSRLSQIRAIFHGGSTIQRQQIRHYFRELDRAEFSGILFTADQIQEVIKASKRSGKSKLKIK
jgi:hypothetical protein